MLSSDEARSIFELETSPGFEPLFSLAPAIREDAHVPYPAVIVLATSKGGSGKSMIAACLAVHWHSRGGSPALVDADPQGSIVKWLGPTGPAGTLKVEADPTEKIRMLVSRLTEGHRPVIIDTPGFRSRATVAALASAELALIPVKPSPMDVRVALETQNIVVELNQTKERSNRPIVVRFILTMTTPGSVIAREIRAQMAEAGLPLLVTEIANRVGYGEAALLGSTPTVSEPKGAAAQEIARLAQEIENLVP
jgi:chromosome partitioning protein